MFQALENAELDQVLHRIRFESVAKDDGRRDATILEVQEWNSPDLLSILRPRESVLWARFPAEPNEYGFNFSPDLTVFVGNRSWESTECAVKTAFGVS